MPNKYGPHWIRFVEAEDRLFKEFTDLLIARTAPEDLLRAGSLLTTGDIERNQELPLDLGVPGPEGEIGGQTPHSLHPARSVLGTPSMGGGLITIGRGGPGAHEII